MMHRSCPCASGRTYSECCEPFHLGLDTAPTAERLMRSRYSAFHEGTVDYLIATTHPSQRRVSDHESLSRTVATTTWTGLRILWTEGGTEVDDSGHVEFVAYYREGGPRRPSGDATHQLHERSQFVREDGRWYYLSGDHDDLRPVPTPGRNAPCWCGSGKKYKKCHG